MKRMLLPAAMLLCATTPTQAETQPEVDCNNAMTTPELNACAEKTFNEADKKLNQAYQALMKTLSQPDEDGLPYSKVKSNLREGQRAWVTFRQKDCDAVFALHSGGTIRSVMYWGCMTDRTSKRTEELTSYIYNE
ncbi:lysozyme inhibitor LprI family protein [Leminorella grimontii]|uniref:lysozyme inhibitor LprI family protein n=1 Tax=Leminorella grimontii TaxID=82981 RepID=UPI00208C83AC|nr:lysozyme inhibitor LprI family protein [Leminorella grimontii]GKX58971.1 hypothetical protein SOASR031_12860 [Leminorella grimontii]